MKQLIKSENINQKQKCGQRNFEMRTIFKGFLNFVIR